MKIKFDPSNSLHRITDPSFAIQEVYLSNEVIMRLKSEGKIAKLDDMQFQLNLSGQEWEISDEPPIGIPGRLASIIFYVQGAFYQEDGKIICTISQLKPV